jgi:HD-GYP domain-containing protein (c-di-GMP phosphodiesterase class II)
VSERALTVAGEVRTAEVIAALSLATDLAMGLPLEHGLEGTLVAVRLCERLGVDDATAAETYYVSMLLHVGCTADAEVEAEYVGGDLHEEFLPVLFGSRQDGLRALLRVLGEPGRSAAVRAAQTARRLPVAARRHPVHLLTICEVGRMLAERLGLPPSVHALFGSLTERWDGTGLPAGARGEEIPLPMRIAHVARDATFHRMAGGTEHAARVVRARAGSAFDPAVARLLAQHAAELLEAPGPSAWEAAIAAEPCPGLVLRDEAIDRALAAIGDFADLISPYLAGHSAGVAGLASAAALRCGLGEEGAVELRRAALVHDLGRVAVTTRTWQRPGPLSADEWEHVRLHPYHAERVLCHTPFLARLAAIASAHHERLDGSGYHRGAHAPAIGPAARVLAAADAYHAMTEPRAHRMALDGEQAARTLAGEASAGRLDADAVRAVLGAAGRRAPHLERPAGLTEREAEVVALLARGMLTKQIARALGISAKTADRHIQNAYAKIGVSTRAAAALFAMEHGLTAWGELPMASRAGR